MQNRSLNNQKGCPIFKGALHDFVNAGGVTVTGFDHGMLKTASSLFYGLPEMREKSSVIVSQLVLAPTDRLIGDSVTVPGFPRRSVNGDEDIRP